MADKHAAPGFSAEDGLALLKKVHGDGLSRGRRDDQLMMEVGAAIEKLEPPPPPPKAAAHEAKAESKGGAR